MAGVSGYTPYQNTIHIYINIDFPDNWQKSLRQTLTHEYAHSVHFQNKFTFYKLSEAFIFEGLAEIFREETDGTGKSPMTRKINIERTLNYFSSLSKKYSSTDFSLYQNVFFGDDNFPTWTGYKIGYLLSKKYRSKNKSLSWEKIFLSNPKDIFDYTK